MSEAPVLSEDQARWLRDVAEAITENMERVIHGKRRVIQLVLATALAGGHVLLEDVPGTGKTALARALAQSIRGTTSRIQFTPDLLPGDITGISVFEQHTGAFVFHPGPLFANVVLADEINRASPKTQSALLEVMEEGQVTVDGTSHPAPPQFLVIATQNPVEQAGTYRLPEAQLDRFMVKTSIGYPDSAAMMRILQGIGLDRPALQAVVGEDTLLQAAALARTVYVNPLIADYVVRLVDATRQASEVRLGASVRGGMALIRLACAWAALHGRTYVLPEDIRDLAVPVLAHRLVLEPDAEFDGVTAVDVVGQVLLMVPVPEENSAA